MLSARNCDFRVGCEFLSVEQTMYELGCKLKHPATQHSTPRVLQVMLLSSGTLMFVAAFTTCVDGTVADAVVALLVHHGT